jgi:hypothetical protein
MHIGLGIFRRNRIDNSTLYFITQNAARVIRSRQINKDGATETNQQDNSADEIKAFLHIDDLPFHVVPAFPPGIDKPG